MRKSPSCRVPNSRATFISVGFPFVPIKTAELAGFSSLPHALQRCVGPGAVALGPRGHQPGDFLAVARNHDLLALLDEGEQLAELVLGFEGTNLAHQIKQA